MNQEKTKLSFGSGVIAALLLLALVALFERILYDVARIFVTHSLSPDYFNNFGVIISHAIIIIPLIIISVVLNTVLGIRKQKYAIAVIPYFVLSAILALQLAIQIIVYFGFHHTNVEFYILMLVAIFVLSYAIYYIQKRHQPNA